MAPIKEKAQLPSSNRTKPAKSRNQKEIVNSMFLFDQASYEKLISEAPKYKLITPPVFSNRLRTNGSLARRAIKGLIFSVSAVSSQHIYTGATNTCKNTKS
ncbi:hypothetical protein MKW92_044880 [Papaver armeniacum]|nr:hypothetical protein MKW92_026069 [Papaver armeniacum]KAI3959889.1 hypothetical protein MKW92_044880 [Papaver armeniacum]